MTGNFVGKITFADFGIPRDYPSVVGMIIEIQGDGWCIRNTKTYAADIVYGYNYMNMSKEIYTLLLSAQVDCVSELIGKKVEVTLIDDDIVELKFI